jgi:hypothetical protein
MIYHIVLYKFKKRETTSKKIEHLYTALRSLKAIPGVLSVDFGDSEFAPFSGYQIRDRDYTHALLVVLKDRRALQEYAQHSTHLLVRDSFIVPLLASNQEAPVLAMDFEGNFIPKRSGFLSWLLPEFDGNTIVFAGGLLTLFVTAGFVLRKRLSR